jgi:hypothetical protein
VRGGEEAAVRGYMANCGAVWKADRLASVSVQLFPLVIREESVWWALQ